MEFWFKKGVYGVRLDAPQFFIEDKYFRDEPVQEGSQNKALSELAYHDLKHVYTFEQWESFEVIHELRVFMDEYGSGDGNDEDERYPEAMLCLLSL